MSFSRITPRQSSPQSRQHQLSRSCLRRRLTRLTPGWSLVWPGRVVTSPACRARPPILLANGSNFYARSSPVFVSWRSCPNPTIPTLSLTCARLRKQHVDLRIDDIAGLAKKRHGPTPRTLRAGTTMSEQHGRKGVEVGVAEHAARALPASCVALGKGGAEADLGSKLRHSKFDEPRISRPPSRNLRAARRRSISCLIRYYSPIAFASTLWRLVRGCRRYTPFGSTSKQAV